MDEPNGDALRSLSELDASTEWELDGNLLAANDEDDDDGGMANVPARPHIHPHTDEGAVGVLDSMDGDETIENILDAIDGMNQNGVIDELICIVNTKDGEQLLLTTLERNDHIIGMLSVAKLNWWGSQVNAQNWEVDEE